MPAINDINLTAGATSITLKPQSVETGSAKWLDRSSGVAIGYNPLVVTTESLSQVRRTKATLRLNKLVAPASADGSGFTPGLRLDRFDEVDVVFKCNKRSNELDRSTLLAATVALLQDPAIVAVIVAEEEVI